MRSSSFALLILSWQADTISYMRYLFACLLTVGLLVGTASLALSDNYLKNADFKEGSQMWHGDGQAAFLKPDGTEGSEGDPGAIPVLRVALSESQTRSIYQEFQPQDAPGKVHFSVDVYASLDFKRSKRAEDYQTEDFAGMPIADFMIRYLPDYFQQTAPLKPGKWVTIKATFGGQEASDDRAVYFIVAPGTGVIYIKNPSAVPQG